MTPRNGPRRRPTRRDRAGDAGARQVRFAQAVIQFNEFFLRYTDAVVAANAPGAQRRVQLQSATQNVDDALAQLQQAWTAARVDPH